MWIIYTHTFTFTFQIRANNNPINESFSMKHEMAEKWTQQQQQIEENMKIEKICIFIYIFILIQFTEKSSWASIHFRNTSHMVNNNNRQ